jgi:plasmid stabilization system protein ParE
MAEVIIASPAERDYAESIAWYVERSVRAAERFEAEFERALDAIARDPDRFPKCDDRHSYCSMRRYPFRVIFRRSGDVLVIMAVAHNSRRPEFWVDR